MERELGTEVGRRLAPAGLVLCVHLQPDGRFAGVEGHGDQVGFPRRGSLINIEVNP